jgi:hypothetical protein
MTTALLLFISNIFMTQRVVWAFEVQRQAALADDPRELDARIS